MHQKSFQDRTNHPNDTLIKRVTSHGSHLLGLALADPAPTRTQQRRAATGALPQFVIVLERAERENHGLESLTLLDDTKLKVTLAFGVWTDASLSESRESTARGNNNYQK